MGYEKIKNIGEKRSRNVYGINAGVQSGKLKV
jgi:hypothetical protein